MTAKQEDLDTFDQLCFEAMNTTFYFSVADCKITNWKEIMKGWVIYVEKEWSRFQLNNELSQLNFLEIGERITLSPPLFDVIQYAEDYRQKTNGLFSPYLLPQMQYHGYNHSFPFHSSTQTNIVMPLVYQLESGPFEIDFQAGTVKRVADGQVDLGGIGKGYAVQAAARWLKHLGKATTGMVDGGGDMTVWSNGKKEWTIGIANPFQNDLEIGQFHLKNGSIATSNIVYRSWRQGNETKHHLLNGRTGLPVENDIIQATVVAGNCLDAEVSAKLCFMEKEQRLEDLLEIISPKLPYLLVTKEGKIVTSERGTF